MRRPAAAALALVAGAAGAETPVAASRVYVCDGAAVLRVVYLNPPGARPMAVIDWGGALIPMAAARTGSGALYLDLDAGRGLRWRTKGAEGFLARDAADGEAMPLRGCAAVED